MKREINSYLNNLLEKGCLYKEKNNCYIKFKNFKSFKINQFKIKNIDSNKILILKNNKVVFEYWIKQDTLIPPWQTHWFQLKDNFLFKLKGNLLNILVRKCIKKANNINRLCRSIGMSYPTFHNFINKKGIKMISVKKLRKLLDYLDRPYNNINNKVEYTKKGNKISINRPKFPIDLENTTGAYLLGSVVSDGCIYVDKKAKNQIRTKYSSDKESVNKFTKKINNIFGEVCFSKEVVRNCTIIRAGSSIIGESLLKIGAILGHKAKVNGNVPWLIKYGNKQFKRAYLQAVFDDESCVYLAKNKLYNSYIIMSRYNHLNLTNEQKILLKRLEKDMTSRKFPTGHINKSISIKKVLEKIEDKDLVKSLNSAPKLLKDESFILKELDVENRLWGRSLNRTHLGNYSICFDLFINKKDSLKKFYKEVGFSLKYKQNKLIKIIGGESNIKII